MAVTFPMRVAVGQSEMQMTMSMYKVQLVIRSISNFLVKAKAYWGDLKTSVT